MLSSPRWLCQSSVDELHGHRPLADGGGASLGRAGADVTGREDARDAGLEQGVRRPAASAREDEAVVVAGDRGIEPVGARERAEEEEQEGEGQTLAAREGDRLELPSVPCRAAISLRSRTATPSRARSRTR